TAPSWSLTSRRLCKGAAVRDAANQERNQGALTHKPSSSRVFIAWALTSPINGAADPGTNNHLLVNTPFTGSTKNITSRRIITIQCKW
ncbi:hypothetical protein HN873_068384, partial [Arachis hypogaea]